METNQTSVPLILRVLVRDIDNNPPLLYIVENGVLPVLTNTFHARIEENAVIRTPIELVLPGSQIAVQDHDMVKSNPSNFINFEKFSASDEVMC